jgi:hypothetical protein
MEVSGKFHTRDIYPLERTLYIHLTGGWIDPRAGLDVSKRRKTSASP